MMLEWLKNALEVFVLHDRTPFCPLVLLWLLPVVPIPRHIQLP